ncbi:hypothetical protein ABKV19_002429 [Rosa sericea]
MTILGWKSKPHSSNAAWRFDSVPFLLVPSFCILHSLLSIPPVHHHRFTGQDVVHFAKNIWDNMFKIPLGTLSSTLSRRNLFKICLILFCWRFLLISVWKFLQVYVRKAWLNE